MKLDPDQQKAVEHFEGPALVVAGPGSGKTTVIKERILHLIREHNVDPEQILAIAFTNAAADEMTDRLSNEPRLNHGKPKTCTLHAFGKDLITDNHEQAGFKEAPHNIWDADDIGQVINEEKYRLQRTTDTARVAIYKFEGMATGRCYIGQTTDPERREQEHRTYSSNRGLREALQTDDEKFEFKVIATVIGQNADDREAHEIRSHKNRAAINLDQNRKKLENVKMHFPVFIYKIKSRTTVTCWIGQSEEPEQSIEDHYNNSSNDDLHEAIENGNFEIITEKLPRDKAARRVLQEIEKHKNWAVFNRQDPLQAKDSNRRRIEIFCEYFNISYDEVIEHTQKFRDLMKRFDTMKDDIEKVKRQVDTGLFKPCEIADPVLRAFATRYEDRKTEAKAIDFLDMLIYSADMLEKHPELLHEYRKKYRYVFVDEFQDISPVDFRLINLFPENLFTVGDDDQAIYGFRGGDSEIMQEKFGEQANVANYEITRNYRSTSSIIKHTRSLILYNNPHRFSKNLRAENSAESRVEVVKTSPDTIENILLSELLPIVTVCETHFKENTPYLRNPLLQELTVPQKIGILARNWYEVKKVRQILRNSKLLALGFRVDWSEADDAEKRKMFLRRGTKEIEVSTIHSAKGREWEKVILILNTIANSSGKLYTSMPDSRNHVTDERRVFYVAITRAKQELVVLGGNCQFISEFQNLRSIEIVETIESQINKELEEVSQKALETLKSKLKQELEDEITTVLKQSDKLNRLRSNVTEAEKASKQMEIDLPQQVKSTNDAFLKRLIPVLDEFESLIKSLPITVESNKGSDNFAAFTETVQLVHKQLLLNPLKNYGLKPIEACGKIFNPTYHEKIQPATYSDDVPEDRVIREERRGYLLHDRIIRKTQVVISKGENIWSPERLDRIVETYLDRLIVSRFGPKYDLDKPIIRRKIRKYLVELDEASLKKINSAATTDTTEYIKKQPLGNYCVGQHTIHMCTDIIFRKFWKHMWEVVEQSRKTSKPKIKRVRTSVDKPTSATATKTSTSDVPLEGTTDPISKAFTDGEIVKGIVVNFNRDEVRIDIGFKSEGYIPASEFKPGQDDLPTVQVGNEIDVYIVRREDSEGQIVLSKKIADQILAWDELATSHETGAPVKGRITQRIKGGLRVSVGPLRGFLPASEVELRPIQNLEHYIGQTLDMKITSLSKRRHNIVLSRRAWLEAKLVQKRVEIFNTLKVGQRVIGVVKNITTFGAFIDLGGVDGLLHKSEMAWKRIDHPSAIVSVGEEVEVEVIEFNRENEKISLSLKQLTSDPWKSVEEKYSVGSTVRGVVVNIVSYGAFLQLEEGVEGLIHVSEMSWTQHDVESSHIVSKGDKIEAMVLEISKEHRRISLSIKQCQRNPLEVEGVEPSTDKPVPIMEIESEISKESPELRDIKLMNKTVEAIPMANGFPLAPETQHIPLYEPINLIVPEPVEKVVDTPPPMSKEYSEIFNTYLQELKPETLESVKTGHVPLYEPTDLIVPEPVKGVVDSRLPMPRDCLEIPNSQIQNLTPETLEIEIGSKPRAEVNNNSQLTAQEREDILKTHIQNLTSETLETKDMDNTMRETILETDIDNDTSVDSTLPTSHDSPIAIGSEARQIEGQDSLEDDVEHVKKGLGYYLRQGRRFVIGKLKAAIFRKPRP